MHMHMYMCMYTCRVCSMPHNMYMHMYNMYM